MDGNQGITSVVSYVLRCCHRMLNREILSPRNTRKGQKDELCHDSTLTASPNPVIVPRINFEF